jgi:hypothetical protein
LAASSLEYPRKRIRRLSGDHAGAISYSAVSRVMFSGSVPSAFMTWMSFLVTNAMREPSGDQAGS